MLFLSYWSEASAWLLVPVAGFVTGLWDRILRAIVQRGYFPVMAAYFKAYSVLGAVAIATVIGAATTALLVLIASAACGQAGLTPALTIQFLAWTALFSAVVGLLMRWYKLFPPLDTTYYAQPLPVTFTLDGLSGVLVMLPTIAIMGNYRKSHVCFGG